MNVPQLPVARRVTSSGPARRVRTATVGTRTAAALAAPAAARVTAAAAPARAFVAVLSLLAALAAAPRIALAEEPPRFGPVVLHAGELLSVPGKAPLTEQTIIVQDGRIAALHEGFRSPAALGLPQARLVDLSTRFVMPGLIDTHVHLTTVPKPGGTEKTVTATDADLAILAAVHAERILRAGFTTVMDMGTGRRAHEKAIYAVRDAIAAGLIPGPEVLAAGSPISATGASRTERFKDEVEAVVGPQGVCRGAAACRDAVRTQLGRGADFINFYNTGSLLTDDSPARTFTFEEMLAIVEEAHALNAVAVADGGNTPDDARGIDDAIRAGADIIDTVTYPGRDTFRLLRSRGGYFAPHVYALTAAVGDERGDLESGSMGWLPRPILLRLFDLKQETPSAVAGYRAGARLILAADSGVFDHGLNAHELIEYTRLGIDPMNALEAATVNAAAAHRILERTGTIEAGKEADIVAFPSSPLKDMTVVIEPLFVMSDGRVHPPAGPQTR